MPLFTDPIDLLLDDDGDITVDSDLHFSSGLDGVVQAVRVRLLMFRGEWFRDLDRGIPYFQSILGQKFTSEDEIRRAFRTEILSTPDVVELIHLKITFDNSTRELRVDWKVRTEFGDSELETTET